MFFGFYKDISVFDATFELNQSGISMGLDIWFDMLTDGRIANSEVNDSGSAYVAHLPNIRMQPVK